MMYKGSLTNCVSNACAAFQSGVVNEVVIVCAEQAKYYKLYDMISFAGDQERMIKLGHRILFHGSGGELRKMLINPQLNLWAEKVHNEQTKDIPGR